MSCHFVIKHLLQIKVNMSRVYQCQRRMSIQTQYHDYHLILSLTQYFEHCIRIKYLVTVKL